MSDGLTPQRTSVELTPSGMRDVYAVKHLTSVSCQLNPMWLALLGLGSWIS